MPSLKEIKNRISSVNSTRKITSAMKMVASSKLHHAQIMIGNMLPYESMLEHILKAFLASEVDATTVYNTVRPVKKVAFVVYSSNSSLCGGFNANVIKAMQQAIDKYQRLVGMDNIVVYPIGRKVAEKVTKLGLNCGGDFSEIADKPDLHRCIELADLLSQKFIDGEFDRIEMIYHHFKSAGSQILTQKTFLPINIKEELDFDDERDLTSNIATLEAQEYICKKGKVSSNAKEAVKPLNDNFIVEPDMESVLCSLIPKLSHLMIYTALLDSNASEHAARMVAMQTATDNADELLRDLNLQYNKSRQQAITNELLDIVGGTVNS